MSSVIGRSLLLCLATVALFASGCGKQKAEDPDAQRNTNVLGEIFDMYTVYVKKNQKPPQRVADLTLKENQMISPAGYRGLESGDYVVVWGIDPGADPSAVLAYSKTAPTDGGWVLLANGKVKRMTAEEVSAAVKAK